MYVTFSIAVQYWKVWSTIVYSKPGKPLWLPVTAKQFLDASLFHYNKSIQEGHTDQQMVVDNIQKELKELLPEDYNKPAYYCMSPFL